MPYKIFIEILNEIAEVTEESKGLFQLFRRGYVSGRI